jgi:hypothetical protein
MVKRLPGFATLRTAKAPRRMNREGRTLNEIRAAMDATWGP